MQLQSFDYHLPENLIARYPLASRSASRLLCLNKMNGDIEHQQFSDIKHLLKPNDLLILNNTKVMPARLFGRKPSGGKVEILVERILSDNKIKALARSSKPFASNASILLENGDRFTVLQKQGDCFELQLHSQLSVASLLEELGQMPLPPYFDRAAESLDKTRYQTIYASVDGAVAAPTAGLHFDDELLNEIQQQGTDIAYITLHVGLGTFQPVRAEDITQHKMHAEYMALSPSVVEQIKATKQRGGRIIACGTTTVRCLETAARSGQLQAFTGETDIFIYPGFQFQCVDSIITNFHLPKSSLLMLVAAFAGHENIQNAYLEAIAKQYRFYSYGDAMFINR